jgi:hypothetical protein
MESVTPYEFDFSKKLIFNPLVPTAPVEESNGTLCMEIQKN